jgi:hypothetical protein
MLVREPIGWALAMAVRVSAVWMVIATVIRSGTLIPECRKKIDLARKCTLQGKHVERTKNPPQ